MHLTPTDRFWVVTKATPRSGLPDILCETGLSGLLAMARGGMIATDILLMTDDREAAHDRAVSELQLRGSK